MQQPVLEQDACCGVAVALLGRRVVGIDFFWCNRVGPRIWTYHMLELSLPGVLHYVLKESEQRYLPNCGTGRENIVKYRMCHDCIETGSLLV